MQSVLLRQTTLDSPTTYVAAVYDNSPLPKQVKQLDKIIGQQFTDVTTKLGSVTVKTGKGYTVVLVGLGPKKQTPKKTADTLADVLKGLRGQGHTHVSVLSETIALKQPIYWCTQAAMLGLHRFTQYKTKNIDELPSIEHVHICCAKPKKAEKEFEESVTVARAILHTRDVINSPANKITPSTFEHLARNVAHRSGLSMRVLHMHDFEQKGMGCIAAVGKGSNDPPRMIILEYTGGSKRQKPVALVGKGITFDTGGYNLKPSSAIGTMKMDKGGAVSVLHVIEAVAKLKLKVNVIAALAVAENKVSSTAYLPDDILTAYNGMTVEIGNTDAEGRLVLADTLSYISERKPSAMIDVATLTGASIIALGWFTIALMGTDNKLIESLKASGKRAEEKIWDLPLYDEFDDAIKSSVADLNNITEGLNAGCIIGGTFLKNFVGDIPWAHLDIGATAYTKAEKGMNQKGATGATVRLLVEMLKKYK